RSTTRCGPRSAEVEDDAPAQLVLRRLLADAAVPADDMAAGDGLAVAGERARVSLEAYAAHRFEVIRLDAQDIPHRRGAGDQQGSERGAGHSRTLTWRCAVSKGATSRG